MKYKTFWLAGILAPMLLSNIAHAVEAAIATGVEHTLFIDSGNVYGMGGNSYGAVKNEATAKYLTPQFTGIGNAKSVAAGYGNSAALKYDGTVSLWGRKAQSMYVVGGPSAAYTPPVDGSITDVAFNWNAFLYVKNGVAYKWDYVNAPVAISYPGDGQVKSIAAGEQHVVALFADGTIGTYGTNNYGQLGNGVQGQAHSYVTRIAGITGVEQIAAGKYSTFVTTNTGDVYGFGANGSSQMGDGLTAHWFTPKLLPYIKGAKKVYGSNIATLALMPDGSMRAAGFPNMIYGALYNYAKTWTTLAAVTGAIDIAQGWGDANMYKVNVPGTINGWSMNRQGQIGSNSLLPELHTIQVANYIQVPSSASVSETLPTASTPAGAVLNSPFQNAPVVTSPVVTAPVVTAPVVIAPVATAPVVTKPVVTAPVVTKPVVTAPVVTKPLVTAPVVTKPVVTAPVVTKPVVTAPVVTKPLVTAPVVTKPLVTAPVVTKPVIPATTYVSMQQCNEATTPNKGQGQDCKNVIVPADRGNGAVIQANKTKP